MAKFDLYRAKDGDLYLLDCQADLLGDLNSRFVVPLMPQDQAPKAAARLNPVFDIAGEALVMVTQFAATVPLRELGAPLMSLQAHEREIGNALDMLICGF
ncbi:CcdB family protein [Sphingobium amiense]|uniref:CcdB family protein n=1 Tax=Sphingobium amiense TaxID=135719 RepID=UPI0008337703|nr:CcdB family protein [Sphingobium amiense]